MRRKERRVQVDFFYHMVSRRSRVCNVSKVTDGRHLFPWRRRCEAYQTFGKKNFWRYRHPNIFKTVLVDKIAVTTPGEQLEGFPGPRGAMRVGPGVSVPVFAVPGKQNPTWVRIRPNNEGNPPPSNPAE